MRRSHADATYGASSRSSAKRPCQSVTATTLVFAHECEHRFVHQGGERRSIEETLDLAWQLLRDLPEADLKRINPDLVARYGRDTAPTHAADTRWGDGPMAAEPGSRESPE
jgi:hypothetical protein